MGAARSRFLVRTAAAAFTLVALAGCGGDDSAESADTTTTTEVETTTTAEETTATTGPATGEDVWLATAVDNRGRDGERFTVACTPDGTEAGIWGVELYTDDSSICTAAVHVGLITFDEGGEVEYEVAPGQDAYDSGVGHGVLSNMYGSWGGSFFFPAAPPGTGAFEVGANSWERTAVEYRGRNGEIITVECSPGGPPGAIWGTGIYTDDSSICTAAVHHGLISVDEGGRIAIEIAPGADSYEGTTANGVTSNSYPSFEGSFTFPDIQPTA